MVLPDEWWGRVGVRERSPLTHLCVGAGAHGWNINKIRIRHRAGDRSAEYALGPSGPGPSGSAFGLVAGVGVGKVGWLLVVGGLDNTLLGPGITGPCRPAPLCGGWVVGLVVSGVPCVWRAAWDGCPGWAGRGGCCLRTA